MSILSRKNAVGGGLFVSGTSAVLLWIAVVCTVCSRHIHDTYVMKMYGNMIWDDDRKGREYTYFGRDCDSEDVTANSREDFTIDPGDTLDEKVDKVMTHGAAIIKEMLTENTTAALREYVLDANRKTSRADSFYVHGWENRWSLKIGLTDHWSIAEALKEIGEHPVLMPIVESILGPHAAIMEVTTITSAYGAEAQHWHSDTVPHGSDLLFGRAFLPSYTLFIPLQDTTDEIGATRFCPGSHMCSGISVDDCTDAEITAEVSGGSAFFMNQNAWHAGGGHVDPYGLDRVMFIVSFMFPPKKDDHRLLPFGLTYSTRWDQFGHTVEDLLTSKEYPWNALTSLGIFRGVKQKYWGWTSSMLNLMLAASGGNIQAGIADYREIFYERLIKVESILPLYYIIALLCHANFAQKKKSSGKGAVKNIFFVFHVTVALCAVIGMKVLRESDWAKDIASGKRFHVPNFKPFPEELDTPQYSQSVYRPHRDDVLFGDRLDYYYLYSNRKFLDYHPGNVMFREEIQKSREIYPNMPLEFKEEFVMKIVWKIRRETLFLKQNEYGDWVPMDMKEIFEVTRQALLNGRDSATPIIIEKINFISSRAKYDYGCEISERFIPGVMNNLKKRVYDEGAELSPMTHSMIHHKLWTNQQGDVDHMMKYKSSGMYRLAHERQIIGGREAAVFSVEAKEDAPSMEDYENESEELIELVNDMDEMLADHRKYLQIRDISESLRRKEETEDKDTHELECNTTLQAIQEIERRILKTEDASLLQDAIGWQRKHQEYLSEREAKEVKRRKEDISHRSQHQKRCSEHSAAVQQVSNRVHELKRAVMDS